MMRQRLLTKLYTPNQITQERGVILCFFSSGAHASYITKVPFHFPLNRAQTYEFIHYDYVARYAIHNTIYNPFRLLSFSCFFLLSFVLARLVFLCSFFLYSIFLPDTALIPKFFYTIYWATYLKIYTILHVHNPQAESISKSKRKHVKCEYTHTRTGILSGMGNIRNDSWKRESNLRLNPCHMHVAYLCIPYYCHSLQPTNQTNKAK